MTEKNKEKFPNEYSIHIHENYCISTSAQLMTLGKGLIKELSAYQYIKIVDIMLHR